MSHKGMGLTAIVDADDRVLGVFTDGDLRRVLDQGIDVREVRVDAVMTRGGKTARADQLAAEAVALMEQYKITALLIEDDRSEEHTSELQSLMRISYAVFCLKKKKKIK